MLYKYSFIDTCNFKFVEVINVDLHNMTCWITVRPILLLKSRYVILPAILYEGTAHLRGYTDPSWYIKADSRNNVGDELYGYDFDYEDGGEVEESVIVSITSDEDCAIANFYYTGFEYDDGKNVTCIIHDSKCSYCHDGRIDTCEIIDITEEFLRLKSYKSKKSSGL